MSQIGGGGARAELGSVTGCNMGLAQARTQREKETRGRLPSWWACLSRREREAGLLSKRGEGEFSKFLSFISKPLHNHFQKKFKPF